MERVSGRRSCDLLSTVQSEHRGCCIKDSTEPEERLMKKSNSMIEKLR
ncbi:hypothetical protein APTSU1_001756300 [Apodemus speciosus]|uniref:Uncharacterized protein n=1 Tax=Apodemus speciosus TaxID=105296 RepID=A0ABQ0FSU9_APOSI